MVYFIQKMNNKELIIRIPGNLKYTKSLGEICSLVDINIITLKKRIGISSYLFFIWKTSCAGAQRNIIPWWALVQSCQREKNVTYKELGSMSATFLVVLENLLFKNKVVLALPW